MTLDTVGRGVMCKKQINIQSDSFALAYSFFFTVAVDWSKCAIFWGVGGCLEGVDGVWGVSEASWILPGWY